MSFLVLPAVGLALFLVGAFGTAAVVFPLFLAVSDRVPGLARASLLVAALPVIGGMALALAGFLPGDPHLDSLLVCHCATSMPGWLHLCPLHPTTAPAVLVPMAIALVLLVPGRTRALATLVREPLGTGTGAAPTLVDLPHPTALLAGWLRPSLLIDRRLWAALQPEHRDAVLAHERAHLARRDPLVLAALRLLTSVAPGPLAQPLLRRWLDHAERRADAAATAEVDPLTVAEALVTAARLGPATPTPRLGWTAGGVDARVRALIDLEPGTHPARADAGLPDLAAGCIAAGTAIASAPWLHHQVEHLLNLSL